MSWAYRSTRWGQRQRRIERLTRDRLQGQLLVLPVLTNGVGAVSNPAPIVSLIGRGKHRVELVDRVHHGHRHTVGAAKPPTLALHTALLVAAVVTGLAIPRLETVFSELLAVAWCVGC
jgi:hypothetical protein